MNVVSEAMAFQCRCRRGFASLSEFLAHVAECERQGIDTRNLAAGLVTQMARSEAAVNDTTRAAA